MNDPNKPNGFFPLPVTTGQFQIGFYLLIALAVIHLLWRGRSFQFDDLLFPLLVGIPTIVIAVIHAVFLIFPTLEKRITPEAIDITDTIAAEEIETAEPKRGRSIENRQRYGAMVIIMVTLLPIFIFYFGFAYVVSPFVLVSIWVFRRDLPLALAVTVGFSIAAYVLFIIILQMQPYQGALDLPNLLRIIQFR